MIGHGHYWFLGGGRSAADILNESRIGLTTISNSNWSATSVLITLPSCGRSAG
jgi:hypothetical protein